jgi:SAM-dependent methyltransferase
VGDGETGRGRRFARCAGDACRAPARDRQEAGQGLAEAAKMTLADEYGRQLAWRDWETVFHHLPSLRGQRVLDLGSGVGDQAAELARRGARVIGVDLNEELVRAARSRSLENTEFLVHDLSTLPALGQVDGIWCSFAAAYFPDLPAALGSWATLLRPGGWVALTEVDDLFGHEPLGERTKSFFARYALEALAAKRYDFHMGHRLAGHLERCGFTVDCVLRLQDQELSFTGAALPEVVDAWRSRLDRLRTFRDLCGPDFESVKHEFLECLTRADHRSTAKVYAVIAAR